MSPSSGLENTLIWVLAAFVGLMDEVSTYRRALSGSELLEIASRAGAGHTRLRITTTRLREGALLSEVTAQDAADLLAYLDRTGYLLSAPIMARVMALPPH